MHAGAVQAVTSVVRPTASYRALELGVDTRLLGLLSAGFAVVPLVAALGVGRLTDRRGERPVLLGGALVVLGACASFALVGTTLPLLVLASALLGLGHLLVMVAEQSLVAGAALRRPRDATFGHYTFAVAAGQAVGPVVLGVVGGSSVRPDTGTLFLSGTALAVVLLVVAAGLGSGQDVRVAAAAPPRAAGLLGMPGLPAAVLAGSVVVSALDVVAVYLPALGTERGLTARTVGGLLVLRAVASMASRLFLAAGVERLGRVALLVTGAVAAGAALVLLALPLPVGLLAAAVAVVGLGLGVGQPLTMSWVTLLAPPHARATAVSLRLTGNRLGQAVVPGAVGLVAGPLGARAVLAVTGVLLAALTTAAARRVGRVADADREGGPGGP